MASTNSTDPKVVRCAVYTRKSTEEGLEQSFNSLDAQRDAGESYVRSQSGEGWVLLETRYDDGGYTGANIDRPALRRLMTDAQAGKVDCVVVYKVDRLSRNIRDFARMMEVFDKSGTTFVSVTQQFNTTTSLGRLTLNILLSFAQFEREIISERTKDKQAAARRRGKWTGGHLVLGYDLDPATGKLVVNEKEAELVRRIFNSYLEGGTVFSLKAKAAALGWRNKQWTTRQGKTYGGAPMGRCHFYSMLSNVLYTGKMRVGDELHPGEHEAIIDEKTFDLAQAKLKCNSPTGDRRQQMRMESLLRGLIYCSCCGSSMHQTYSASKEKRYRYYICSRAQQPDGNDCITRSVSAPVIEDAVIASIRRVSVHERVIEETARIIRFRLTNDINRLGDELKTLQARVKNLKSQVARARESEEQRKVELANQIHRGECRVAELKREIAKLERVRKDGAQLPSTMDAFDSLWKSLNLREQCLLLRQLVEKVGYESRTGRVTVSFKSASVAALCQP